MKVNSVADGLKVAIVMVIWSGTGGYYKLTNAEKNGGYNFDAL